jgi:hypothetical protein
MSGCVGAWVRGCVGAWVRGCVGAWVRDLAFVPFACKRVPEWCTAQFWSGAAPV